MRSKKKNDSKQMDELAASIAAVTPGTSGEGAADAASRPQASRWLEQVDGEAERLRHRWNEAQAELERTELENRELDKANAQLRREVTDLKAYIDGRKEHWAHLQKRVEQYEDTIAGMEQVVRDAENKLSRKDGERQLLSTRIIELERRCAELAGRLQERERSQRDDGRRLKETDEELERQRGELEKSRAAAAELKAAVERTRTEVRSLRQELVAQQNLIGKLEAEIEAKQSTIEALEKQADARASSEAAVDAATNGSPANGSPARPDGSENVEIIRIGELFRHEAHSERTPIAALEASDGTTYLVTKPNVTIGRASSNDICIRREFVSRVHARLLVRGIGAIIEDAGSKNGILVNSEPVGRRLLVDGDVVSLGGKLDLKFVELDASAPVAPNLQAGAEGLET